MRFLHLCSAICSVERKYPGRKKCCYTQTAHPIHSYNNKAAIISEAEMKSWEFDNFYLIVFKQLRPLLLICWSDKVTFHIKWNWVKMDCFYELKSFQLSKTYPSSHKISGDVLMHANTCTCRIESIGANIRPYTRHLKNPLNKIILGNPVIES